jgi:hypothetical protein
MLSKVRLLLSSTLVLLECLQQKKLSNIDPQACTLQTISIVELLEVTKVVCKQALKFTFLSIRFIYK